MKVMERRTSVLGSHRGRSLHGRLERMAELAIILAAVVTVVFIIGGFPLVGHDAYFNVNNLAHYSELRSHGIAIPRWVPAGYDGFGSAIFYFYPPMTYILGSALHLIIPSVPWTFRLLLLLAMAGSLVSCQWYLRILKVPTQQAWLGALMYAMGPYPFFDVLIRSAYAEYLTLPWIPVILGSIELSLQTDLGKTFWRTEAAITLRTMVLTAIGCSMLVLSSIPAAAVVIIGAYIYLLIRAIGRPLIRTLPFIGGAILAFACIAFFVLPISHFQNLTSMASLINTGTFNSFALGASRAMHAASKLGSVGFLELMLLPLSVFAFVLWGRRWWATSSTMRSTLALCWTALTALVLLVHIPPIAGPLARNFILLGVVQFPLRFFSLSTIAVALFVAVASDRRERASSTMRPAAQLLAIVSSLGTIAIAIAFLHLSRGAGEFPIENKMSWNFFGDAPRQTFADSATLSTFVREHRDDPDIVALRTLSNGDSVAGLGWHGAALEYLVRSQDTLSVRFHQFYWPYWQLTASDGPPGMIGRPLPLASDSRGVLCAKLPAGNYNLLLQIVASPIERLGERISLAGIGFLVIFCFWGIVLELRTKRNSY